MPSHEIKSIEEIGTTSGQRYINIVGKHWA